MGLRIGNGIDVHHFDTTADRPLVLAGVEVGDGPPLAGHSDADVVAHAVADALLGATASGDLGSRFGVDEPATRDADSIGLLAEVVADVSAAGGHVVNVDVTVVAQTPRLAGHRDRMRANLARAAGVDLDAVSVKFTTTDHLGSLGRGEGIAAWATVLVDLGG
ncbi:MAG: 2-C-methyl-D-erythritol 2,4-cyclodiphosphate synthase [Nitriliruptoraceae bacterium]